MFALSVCLGDLDADVKVALDRARDLEFSAVDIPAAQGPISPGELSRTGRRHLLKHLADLGLRLGSLRGPVGGSGYGDARLGEQRLETMRGVMRLAADLKVPVVSTAPGQAAGEPDQSRLCEALSVLADDADRTGVVVAIESAGLGLEALRKVLREINCHSLAACCDSGAMLMQGEDPPRVADALPGRIQLVRARDAVPGSPEAPGYEVTMGEGTLDVPRFLAALAEAGFGGDIVMSRTTGANRSGDLALARAVFLKQLHA